MPPVVAAGNRPRQPQLKSQRQQRKHQSRTHLAGSILWLPRKENLSDTGSADDDLEDGCYQHPVVILSAKPRDGNVFVLVLTSFNERPLEQKHPHDPRARAAHLPIAPSPPHPDSGRLLVLAEASPRLRKRSYVKTSRRRLVRLDGLRPYDSANPAAPYALSPRSFRELVEYARFVDVVGPIVDALPPTGVAPIPSAITSSSSRRAATASTTTTVVVPRLQGSEANRRATEDDDDDDEDPDDLQALVSRLWSLGASADLITNICAAHPASQRRPVTISPPRTVPSPAQQARMAPYLGKAAAASPSYQQRTRTLYDAYGPRRGALGYYDPDDRAAAERRALLPLYSGDLGASANPFRQQYYGSVRPASTTPASFSARGGASAAANKKNNGRNTNSSGNGAGKRSALARGLMGMLERCGGVFRLCARLSSGAARVSWARVLAGAIGLLFWVAVGYGAYRGYRWVRGIVGSLFGAG